MQISDKKLFLGAIFWGVCLYVPIMELKGMQTSQVAKRLVATGAAAGASMSAQGEAKAAVAAVQRAKRKVPDGFDASGPSAKKSKTGKMFSDQDIQRLQVYRVCPAAGEDILSYASDASGQWVALVSAKKNGFDKRGSLTLFNTQKNFTGKLVHSFKEEDAQVSLSFSSDTRHLMAYSAHEKMVRIWDVAADTKLILQEKLEGEQIYTDGVSIATYYQKMVEGQEQPFLGTCGLAGPSESALPLLGAELTTVNISTDATYVIMALAPHIIRIFDRATGSLVREYRCAMEGLVAILSVDIISNGQDERLVVIGRVVQPVTDEGFSSSHPLKKSHDSIVLLIMDARTGALSFCETDLIDGQADKLITYSHDKTTLSYWSQRPTHKRVLSCINIFTNGAVSYRLDATAALADAVMIGKNLPDEALIAVVGEGGSTCFMQRKQGTFAGVDRYTFSQPVTALQPLAEELFVARATQSLEFLRPRDMVVAEIAQLTADQQKLLQGLVTQNVSSITDRELVGYSAGIQRVIAGLVPVEMALSDSAQAGASAAAGSRSGSAGSAAS